MNFVKNIWLKEDFEEYRQYCMSIKSSERDCLWEKKIVNTSLECFGKTSFKAKQIAKEIKKGNVVSFLENLKIENHLDSLVAGYLICSIKDFNLFKNFLDKYVLTIDNWASCDTLKFEKKDKNLLKDLSYDYLKNKLCFVRRVGVNIWFELIKYDGFVEESFKMLNSLSNEEEYYVNMCASWLLAELFIKHRNNALEYFKNNSTNSFIINKAISKCRDSFRVSKEDKDLLVSFKKTKNA